MLPSTTYGSASSPHIFFLHWLGGSAATWTEVAEGLTARGIASTALDLPGFGHASSLPDYAIAASIDQVIEAIANERKDRQTPWLLAGHSMGGKFATIVARAAADGHPELANLRGLILVSPSPPGPEPLTDKDRAHDLDILGHPSADIAETRKHAEAFIDANVGKQPLPAGIHTRTVDDILHMDRAAFTAWLTGGSKEDWAARVGTLPYPALILAGTEEPQLNPEAQARNTLPHLPAATTVALQGSGHLSPLERPSELIARIAAFITSLGIPLERPNATLTPTFRALIDSDRTSAQTRAILLQRLADDHITMSPGILSPEEQLILEAVAERILPGCPFDLAARIHRWLALPLHDGWRHDTLPPDTEAWHTGLRSLDAAALHNHSVPFIALHADQQDTLLTQARDGHLTPGILHSVKAILGDQPELFSAAQMAKWFGDLHAELTRTYMADPRTYERIGFTGFADGADAFTNAGFTNIELNTSTPRT